MISNESDMLFDVPPSGPPRIVYLRKQYDEAKSIYDEAVKWEDESGEAIPHYVIRKLDEAERALRLEESRIASNRP